MKTSSQLHSGGLPAHNLHDEKSTSPLACSSGRANKCIQQQAVQHYSGQQMRPADCACTAHIYGAPVPGGMPAPRSQSVRRLESSRSRREHLHLAAETPPTPASLTAGRPPPPTACCARRNAAEIGQAILQMQVQAQVQVQVHVHVRENFQAGTGKVAGVGSTSSGAHGATSRLGQ